jgi:hypothetical protein
MLLRGISVPVGFWGATSNGIAALSWALPIPAVWIDPSFDLCDPFLVLKNQHHYCNSATHNNRRNWYQMRTQARDRFHALS